MLVPETALPPSCPTPNPEGQLDSYSIPTYIIPDHHFIAGAEGAYSPHPVQLLTPRDHLDSWTATVSLHTSYLIIISSPEQKWPTAPIVQLLTRTSPNLASDPNVLRYCAMSRQSLFYCRLETVTEGLSAAHIAATMPEGRMCTFAKSIFMFM